MGFWQKAVELFIPERLIQTRVEKALAAKRRMAIDDRRAEHLPLQMVLEPGGRGPRKMLGMSFEVLRAFARFNPWLRAAIDIRKREIAAAKWDITPDLDRHKDELDSLVGRGGSVRPLQPCKQLLLTGCIPLSSGASEWERRFSSRL